MGTFGLIIFKKHYTGTIFNVYLRSSCPAGSLKMDRVEEIHFICDSDQCNVFDEKYRIEPFNNIH